MSLWSAKAVVTSKVANRSGIVGLGLVAHVGLVITIGAGCTNFLAEHREILDQVFEYVSIK